ncbi:hypothetical protein [Modestobacter sp. KNN46-3]|uniref:hypothetical protein n=1 Tax=Modestobacter sp. KNN46-3 TaxID=2711218 RepID=UPI0013DEBB14|nr:hypothetical protein [Modestobacter sp. KNN46-3]
MQYGTYLQEVDHAADVTGGTVVSLAGGYFGVQLLADGGYVFLALDLDSDLGWLCWVENADGERCCDEAEEVLGDVPHSELKDRAFTAIVRHQHA